VKILTVNGGVCGVVLDSPGADCKERTSPLAMSDRRCGSRRWTRSANEDVARSRSIFRAVLDLKFCLGSRHADVGMHAIRRLAILAKQHGEGKWPRAKPLSKSRTDGIELGNPGT
jgi:hypothetical protein